MEAADRLRVESVARITLLTDFGTRDGYVGAMKGVIASIFPGIVVDDISHEIPAGDVRAAALTLSRYWNRYPAGTTHAIVVDPGVGTERRAIAAEADRRLFVAPDNGVLSRVQDMVPEMRFVAIENPQFVMPDPSATFHGRDIFAPAAAFLARGVHLSQLGSPITDPIRLDEPEVLNESGALIGEVVSLDRFGNLVTNLPGTCVDEGADVEIDGKTIRVVRTYAEVPRDAVAALVNSEGRVEVAARERSAAELLKAQVGTPVRVPRLGSVS